MFIPVAIVVIDFQHSVFANFQILVSPSCLSSSLCSQKGDLRLVECVQYLLEILLVGSYCTRKLVDKLQNR